MMNPWPKILSGSMIQQMRTGRSWIIGRLNGRHFINGWLWVYLLRSLYHWIFRTNIQGLLREGCHESVSTGQLSKVRKSIRMFLYGMETAVMNAFGHFSERSDFTSQFNGH